MGIKNKTYPGYKYFITLTIVDWVYVFTHPIYKHIIVNSLIYCQNKKGLIIYAWCIMSNHLHLIIEAKEEFNLSDILRDLKKYTSKKIIEAIREYPESRKSWLLNRFKFAGRYNKKSTGYKFWQDGNDTKEIHTTAFLKQKLEYIYNNPVVAEIVDRPAHYKYSSARDYCDEPGLIEITRVY
jgi:REP element-mobilizing transposase RayT